MKIVVGLGNPGKEYAETPHNVGFAVIEQLAAGFDCAMRRSLRFNARIGHVTVAPEPLLLVEPLTFMNRSGDAVAAILGYRKLSTSDMVVVLDDADLDIGWLRIRARGSSGGHRGLDSIIRSTGGDAFARVRIGVGRGRRRDDLVEHLLSRFSRQEWQQIQPEITRAADAVRCVLESGAEAAMNRFNGPPSDETATA